ncbi:MAG: hypothetical protein U1E23_01115 [Reyranellaceae bacterium]
MAKGSSRPQDHRARVRRVLLHDWDPIGIADVPEARAEYDSYANKAYSLLMNDRATADVIAEYLYRVAAGYMGLGRKPGLLETAQRVAYQATSGTDPAYCLT